MSTTVTSLDASRLNEKEFVAGCNACSQKLKNLCLRFGFLNDMDDCIQDIHLRVWTSRMNFDRERGSLEAFIIMVGKYSLIDRCRVRNRKKRLCVESSYPDRVAGKSSSCSEAQSLDFFTSHELELIQFKMRGYAYHQVAEILQIPLGTVKSKYSRIHKKARMNVTD